MEKITPNLWFDGNAEEAARFYVSLFPDSRIDNVVRSPAQNPSTAKGEPCWQCSRWSRSKRQLSSARSVAREKFVSCRGNVMNLRPAIVLCAFGFLFACAHADSQDLPDFLRGLIERYEAGSLQSSPGSIWQYEFDGETVFFVPLSRICCDQMSVLYDGRGEVVCRPDGGIAGNGDGKCPGFFRRRSEGIQVWSDSRNTDGTSDSAER